MEDSTKQKIIQHFHNSTSAMTNVLKEVSATTFCQKDKLETWSIAEVVEHVIKVETGIMGNLQKLGATPSQQTMENPASADQVIERSIDRSELVNSPDMFVPKGILTNKEEAIAAFHQHREKVNQFINTTELPLKNISFPHPRLGLFNGENWLAFMVGHCYRHVEQIKMIDKIHLL